MNKIVRIIVYLLAACFLISIINNFLDRNTHSVVSDAKGIVFEGLGNRTLGEMMTDYFGNVKWSSSKTGDDEYQVIAEGFSKELYENASVTMQVTYIDDTLYGKITRIVCGGQSYTGTIEISLVMNLLCPS